MRSHTHIKYILYALIFSCIQSSCSIIPEHSDTIDRFILDAVPEEIFVKISPTSSSVEAHGKTNTKSATSPTKKIRPTLLIDVPTVYAPLDNSRIVLKPTPSAIDYIADVEWADRLSTLIHESMIQSAQNSRFFQAAGRMSTGLQSSHLLLIDVRQFNKLCCDNSQRVEAEYFVQLLDMQSRQVLSSKSFVSGEKLHDESAGSIALALNSCHKALSHDIIVWVMRAIRYPPPP